MQPETPTLTEDRAHEISLLIETAGDLVASLQELAVAVELKLTASVDVEEVVSLLWRKKAKVDTLNAVAMEITARLRLDAKGRPGITLPEDIVTRFRELMADFERLLSEESRIEDLIGGCGFPVSRRRR